MNSTPANKNASTQRGTPREKLAAIETGESITLDYQPQNSTHTTQTRTGTVTDRNDKPTSGDFWKLTIETNDDGGTYDVWANGSVHQVRTNLIGEEYREKVGANAVVEEVDD